MVKCALIVLTHRDQYMRAFWDWNEYTGLFDDIAIYELFDDTAIVKFKDENSDCPILRIDVIEDKNITTSLTFRDKNTCVVFDTCEYDDIEKQFPKSCGLDDFEKNVFKSLNLLYSKLPKFLLEFKIMHSDFPKPGVLFTDLLPIFESDFLSALFVKLSCDKLNDIFGKNKIDYIVGLEARGFIIGGILANKFGCGFVPVRKAGKLPGETIKGDYVKNYGVDTFEMSITGMKHGKRILIVDDILATGGSINTTIKLLKYFDPVDIGIFVIADIPWRTEVAKEVLGPYYDKVIVLCK
jgi:adenine phosphoribosyltransferase